MIVGPLVWGAHFTLSYALLSIGCALDWQRISLLGVDVIRLVLSALTAVAVLLLIGLAVSGWHRWRAAPEGTAERFSAGSALGLHILSLIAVIWVGMAVPLMRPCTG
jgi:uncharacterized membrane protein YidH (DUF202 family)